MSAPNPLPEPIAEPIGEPHRSRLRDAIRVASENQLRGGGPFGAVIVHPTRGPIAVGANAVTTTFDPTAHAEVVAIRAACQVLKTHVLAGCVLYSSCEPCPMCLSAIYWARLERVYFGATKDDAAFIGFDDAFIYAELAMPLSQRQLPLVRVSELRDEALQPFREWQARSEKTPY